MIHSTTHVSNPHLYSKIPYDTMKDFVGIAPLARQVGILVVHPSLPASTVKEFIDLGRKRPNQITYSSSGNGSFVHLGMALLASMSNTRLVHVPYKGAAPAVVDLISGHVQLSFISAPGAMPL